MSHGECKMFSSERGFGFLSSGIVGERDVFFHISELTRSNLTELKPGDRVSWDTVPDQKSGRFKATNIQLAA